MTNGRLGAIALLMLCLLGAACGRDEAGNTAASSTSTASAPQALQPPASAAGLSVTDASNATITLPTRPRRIVCLSDLCVDILAELAVPPVAVLSTDLAAQPRFFAERAAGFARIGGTVMDPHVEDIIAARPDLVLGDAGVHDRLRERLKGVAPLYLMRAESYNDSIKHLADIGSLTDFDAVAYVASVELTDRLAAYKAGIPRPKTVIVLTGGDGALRVEPAASAIGSLLSEVAIYPWTTKQGASSTALLDAIRRLDPEAIFTATTGGALPLIEQLKQVNPAWGDLRAVQSGAVYEITPAFWITGRGTRSLRSALDQAMIRLYPDAFPTPLKDADGQGCGAGYVLPREGVRAVNVACVIVRIVER